MSDTYRIGDRVEVYLDQKFGMHTGWHTGRIFKIEPYSEHRSFYWVQFEVETAKAVGLQQISVFNPRNLRKLTS